MSYSCHIHVIFMSYSHQLFEQKDRSLCSGGGGVTGDRVVYTVGCHINKPLELLMVRQRERLGLGLIDKCDSTICIFSIFFNPLYITYITLTQKPFIHAYYICILYMHTIPHVSYSCEPIIPCIIIKAAA